MQKWYPESFSNEGSTITAEAPQVSFESLTPPEEETGNTLSLEAQFRSESGFMDAKQLMTNLTMDERNQVFDLVELDVREEYEVLNQKLKTQCENQIQEAQNKFDKSINTWSQEFSQVTEQELKKTSASAARLAILLAEKIVRCQVGIDADVLARTLETSLFKIQTAAAITVTVNPEEAQTLKENSELLGKLNIGVVETDRRIQPGGCLVKNADIEWDATVESQLASMAELVEEMISTSGGVNLPTMSSDKEVGPHEVD